MVKDRELLTQLLLCFIDEPEKVDALVENLLNRRGSLRYLCETSLDQLNKVEGLPPNAAFLLANFQGILTYHYPSDSSGAELAQSIQTAVCQATGGADRGERSADFVVLRETDMSAALVEMGYMSSPGELARLLDASYQDKLAQGIAEGIAQYLGAPE